MAFWERAQSNPEENVFKSVKDGLNLIDSDQAVMHILIGDIKGNELITLVTIVKLILQVFSGKILFMTNI